MPPQAIGLVIAVAVAAVAIVWRAMTARRQGSDIGGRVIVRCRDGQLFTTLWIPGASFKAIRRALARATEGDSWQTI